MTVMMDVWDESQYRKYIFIVTLLLRLSSGESKRHGQIVINIHSSFHRRMQSACQRPEDHSPSTPPSTLPARSQLLPTPRWQL